eukprot:scaffold298824_cov35-Attheya_sp.AAC.1
MKLFAKMFMFAITVGIAGAAAGAGQLCSNFNRNPACVCVAPAEFHQTANGCVSHDRTVVD